MPEFYHLDIGCPSRNIKLYTLVNFFPVIIRLIGQSRGLLYFIFFKHGPSCIPSRPRTFFFCLMGKIFADCVTRKNSSVSFSINNFFLFLIKLWSFFHIISHGIFYTSCRYHRGTDRCDRRKIFLLVKYVKNQKLTWLLLQSAPIELAPKHPDQALK